MKLKYLQIIIYSIWGFISAVITSIIFNVFLLFLFFGIIFKNNSAPDILYSIFPLFPILIFLLMFVLVIRTGIVRGKDLDTVNEELRSVYKKQMSHKLFSAICFLIILLVFLFFQARIVNERFLTSQSEARKAALKYIGRIDLDLKDEKIDIKAVIYGQASDKYKLQIRISADGYLKKGLKTIDQEIELLYPIQSFKFNVDFDDIVQTYKEAVKEVVPNLNKKLGFDELILVEANAVSLHGQEPKNILLQPAYVRMFFSCHLDKCWVESLTDEEIEKLKNLGKETVDQ